MKTTSKLKRKVLMLSTLSILGLTHLKAQDKITLLNGKEINAKVIEVSETEIKYKQQGVSDGPTWVLAKMNVFSILYPNGTKDVFEIIPAVVKPEKNSDYVYYNSLPTNYKGIDTNEFLPDAHKKFSGPRIGVTGITSGTSADYITDKGKTPFVTQFGWQFEERLFTLNNGISGILEFVPLVGGIEQGMFLPSANFLIGLRGGVKKSFEFALGPNLSLSGLGMVFAAGTNFKSGKVNFPINLAIVPSVGSIKTNYDSKTGATTKQHIETGWRISLMVGFNSRKK